MLAVTPTRHWRATTPPSKPDTCRIYFIALRAHILRLQCRAYNKIPSTLLLSLKTGWSSSDMTSFSINSILDLEDSKCGTSPVDRVRKNALAFEQLEDQVMSKDYSDHRRSPNSSPALETDNASYEGKRYTVSCSMVTSILVACLIIWRSGVLEPESSYRTLILWSFVRLPRSLNVRISSPGCATRVLHFGFWISSYRRDASAINILCFNYQTKIILNNYKNTYNINITSLLQFTFGVVLF